jgi:hypothetical protein
MESKLLESGLKSKRGQVQRRGQENKKKENE